MPERWFLQLGTGPGVRSGNVGLIWELDRRWRALGGTLGVATEMSIGRWRADRGDGSGADHATTTQLGVTPALRYTSPGAWGAFGEIGIGVNVITPLYRSGDKRFSTAFNFGDHLAVGVRPWGPAGAELSLRYQHFSNAGIEDPNPGENFLQLRLSLPL